MGFGKAEGGQGLPPEPKHPTNGNHDTSDTKMRLLYLDVEAAFLTQPLTGQEKGDGASEVGKYRTNEECSTDTNKR